MQIVHAANFSLFPKNPRQSQQFALHYSVDRAISSGFVRRGHSVYDFAVEDAVRRYRRFWRGKANAVALMNAMLVDAVVRLNADWLVLGHAPLVFPQTLAALRRQLPKMKISQWWVDSLHPKHADRMLALKHKLPHMDAFFCTTAADYLRHSLADVSKVHFMPNPCDSSVHVGRAFECERYRHDIIFFGRPDTARDNLIRVLRDHFSAFNLGIYGDNSRNELGSHDYIAALSAAKIAINYSRPNDIPLYSSDRIAHITGNGAMALSPRTPKFDLLYADDEVAYFDGMNELRSRLTHYLANNAERCAVACKGWRRTHEDYNERCVTAFMEDVCFYRDVGAYGWSGH